MPTGKQNSTAVTITYDDAPGGTGRAMTAHILSISGIKKEALNERNLPFGAGNPTNIPTGVVETPDITVEGFLDTTSTTGPHVVFGTPDDATDDATRTLVIVVGDSKTFTIETRLKDYEVMLSAGQLSRYKATIGQAGLGAWT